MKVFVLFALLAFSAIAGAAPQRVVIVSDIHFNPLASPEVLPKLQEAQPSAWKAILDGDPHPEPQQYKQDSGWPLLASVIAQIRALEPRPKLILVTGDILPHKFKERFSTYGDSVAFRSLVQKTVTFVSLELQEAAGGAPVAYTLGNNDDECDDYALQPGGPFLQDSLAAVQAMAQVDSGALADWNTLGSYVMNNPVAAHHRIIALNSTFLSNRYKNVCGSEADPGTQLLDWLDRQLQKAQQRGEKVWIVYHIPPGIDGHTSAKRGQATPLWKTEYAERFSRLLDQYSAVIKMNFAGHTHLDDFRLVQTEHASALVLVNPGVSPNIGQNSAYRVMTVDKRGQPIDLFTYYLPDFKPGKWRLEYSARAALKLKHIDAASYAALYRRIEDSPRSIGEWREHYAVSRPASLDASPGYLRSLYCATGHSGVAAFEACLKSSATSWNDVPALQ